MILGAGLVLLLLPDRSDKAASSGSPEFTQEEERLRCALENVDGVGAAVVLLSRGESRNEGYTGAVVVCRGADDPSVQWKVVEAVSAFTGLGSNKIVVQKMISQEE